MDKQLTLLSPEGDAELKRLYADLAHASRRATAFLRTSGITSAAFLRADREVARIVKRIKEVRGLTGKHWMAPDYGLCGPRAFVGCICSACQP
jgi:hypothetical protein